MRDTKIEQERGYLAPYHRELHPGVAQKTIFTPENIGPFWMCHKVREKWRHDTVIEGRVVKWLSSKMKTDKKGANACITYPGHYDEG